MYIVKRKKDVEHVEHLLKPSNGAVFKYSELWNTCVSHVEHVEHMWKDS